MHGTCNAPGVTYPELQTEMSAIRSALSTSAAGSRSEIATELAAVRDEISASAGGSRLRIAFAAGYSGCPFTVTSADGNDSVTGSVAASLVAYVTIKQASTTYTIDVTKSGAHYTKTIAIGSYYGEYRVTFD